MLDDTSRWSHALGNKVVPYRWQATVEARDHWIAIVANATSSMRHLEAPSVMRTIHDNNLTPRSRRAMPLYCERG